MDTRSTSGFLCKKWTLFTFCLIGIIGTIVVAALASSIIDTYVNNNYASSFYDRRQLDDIKSTAKTLIYVVAALSILFQCLGLVGTYKEHYCMTMTYTILMTLGSLGSIANAIRISTFWISTVLYLVILGLAYSFLFDLRKIRREQFTGTSRIYVTNPAPSSTHIHVSAGPSTVYSGSYQQTYANTNYPAQRDPQDEMYRSQYTQGEDPWKSSPAPPPPYQNEKGALP